MKLIAETKQEDRILRRLILFLQDLELNVTGHTSQDSIALTYWTPRDLPAYIPENQRQAFLASIEDDIYSAMITAGYETIEQFSARYLDSHPQNAHHTQF